MAQNINPTDYFTTNFTAYSYKPASALKQKELEPISAVIPTFARCPFQESEMNSLFWSLCSLINGHVLPSEIIIVDNTDPELTDYTKDTVIKFQKILEQDKKKVQVKYLKIKNVGAANSRNLGIMEAHNNLVYLVDDDIVLPSEIISNLSYLIEEIKQYPYYQNTALFCLPQNKRATIPTKIKKLSEISKLNLKNFNFTGTLSSSFPQELIDENINSTFTRPILLGNFQGGNVLINKEIMSKIGYYPVYEAPVTYGEETGLAIKIFKNHYDIVYLPFLNLSAVHLSYGNPNPPFVLTGEDWSINRHLPTLRKMVALSVKTAKNSGARVESPLYFYTKIVVFAQILNDFFPDKVTSWFEHSKKVFVENNESSFTDGKESIKNLETRLKIWQISKDDFYKKQIKDKVWLRNYFGIT